MGSTHVALGRIMEDGDTMKAPDTYRASFSAVFDCTRQMVRSRLLDTGSRQGFRDALERVAPSVKCARLDSIWSFLSGLFN